MAYFNWLYRLFLTPLIYYLSKIEDFDKYVGRFGLSVCLRVCIKSCYNSKTISLIIMKLTQMIDLSITQRCIIFPRSRSKVKVTRGQKVKTFERLYLRNYWSDQLQTKSKNVLLIKIYIPMYVICEFEIRQKCSPEVKVFRSFFTISRFVNDNSKNISMIALKLSQMIDIRSRRKPIVFGRSRSKVKVTSGQKVEGLKIHIFCIYSVTVRRIDFKLISSERASQVAQKRSLTLSCTMHRFGDIVDFCQMTLTPYLRNY